MIGAIAIFCMGLTAFQSLDLPIEVSPPEPLSGLVSANFRLTDVDGNGAPDLVVPDEVFLQTDGRFQTDAPIAMYPTSGRTRIDTQDGALYIQESKRLTIVQWRDGAWKVKTKQAMVWPSPAPEDAQTTSQGMAGHDVELTRFLHDFDGDGIPEIVFPGKGGLHIYRLGPEGYDETTCAPIFPPLHMVYAPASALWPPNVRHFDFPARETACKYVLEANRATVFSMERSGERSSRYRVTTYVLEAARQFQVRAEDGSSWVTEPMSNGMRPCRLSSEDTWDFAGGDWELSQATSLPIPVFETRATFDRGKTWQTFRSVSFRPSCLFIDADGDGRRDLLTESIGLLEGGIRESVDRFLSARQIEHSISIYLQHDKAFPPKPDWHARITISLDAPPLRNTEFFQRYQAGELLDVTGDYDGDGRRDLLVQDRPDRLSVYLSTPNGFGTIPETAIAVERNARFAVCDVNGDGRSDIAVYPTPATKPGKGPMAQVWFSRRAAP